MLDAEVEWPDVTLRRAGETRRAGPDDATIIGPVPRARIGREEEVSRARARSRRCRDRHTLWLDRRRREVALDGAEGVTSVASGLAPGWATVKAVRTGGAKFAPARTRAATVTRSPGAKGCWGRKLAPVPSEYASTRPLWMPLREPATTRFLHACARGAEHAYLRARRGVRCARQGPEGHGIARRGGPRPPGRPRLGAQRAGGGSDGEQSVHARPGLT